MRDVVVDLRRLSRQTVDTAAPAITTKRRRAWPAVAAGTAVLLISAVGALWRRATATTPSTGGAPPIRSIAVLPLQNLSGDAKEDYFSDGMTEELISNLAQVRTLRAISRTSVMRYRGTDKSMPEIGRELGVDAVVEGYVRRAGGRVRVTAQLIHAASDGHLWADDFDRDFADVLQLQADIADAIVRGRGTRRPCRREI